MCGFFSCKIQVQKNHASIQYEYIEKMEAKLPIISKSIIKVYSDNKRYEFSSLLEAHHSGPENLKKSRLKNSSNEMNQFH